MLEYYKTKSFDKDVTIFGLLVIIILLLAITLGLAYALFHVRDDGMIGINVTTGECKVDIVDTSGESLVGDVLDFITDNESDTIYFEPGAVYLTEGFEVENIGTVPVNVRIYVSNDEKIDAAELEEAFELWITDDPTGVASGERLKEFAERLEPEDRSKTYYLVVMMKETAGNAFQNKTYKGIGITVYAVQANAKSE